MFTKTSDFEMMNGIQRQRQRQRQIQEKYTKLQQSKSRLTRQQIHLCKYSMDFIQFRAQKIPKTNCNRIKHDNKSIEMLRKHEKWDRERDKKECVIFFIWSRGVVMRNVVMPIVHIMHWVSCIGKKMKNSSTFEWESATKRRNQWAWA